MNRIHDTQNHKSRNTWDHDCQYQSRANDCSDIDGNKIKHDVNDDDHHQFDTNDIVKSVLNDKVVVESTNQDDCHTSGMVGW